MRLLALVTDAFGGHGGIAQYNRDLLTALSASSKTSCIVCLPRHAEPDATTLPEKIQQHAPVSARTAYSLAAMRLALSQQRYDAVFCGHLYHMPLAVLAARLCRAPLWLQLHGVEAWVRPSRAIYMAVRHADLITSVSRYTRDRFLDWSGVDPSRNKILPNTYHPRFVPGPKPLPLMQQHGLDGRMVILTVSRLSAEERYKGHDKIIAALPAVLRVHPNAAYLIVGDGDDRSRLEQLTQQSGVSEHVVFAGRVPDEALIAYYRLADVFAMPSTGEGFGIVFLEAAATGLPVIGGNRDGSVDALANGEIGLLIDPDNPDELADALITSLSRGRHAYGGTERFDQTHFTARVDDLLKHIQYALIGAR
ncbi:glycosyltransferase family 4 protein [Leptospira interrogans]